MSYHFIAILLQWLYLEYTLVCDLSHESVLLIVYSVIKREPPIIHTLMFPYNPCKLLMVVYVAMSDYVEYLLIVQILGGTDIYTTFKVWHAYLYFLETI